MFENDLVVVLIIHVKDFQICFFLLDGSNLSNMWHTGTSKTDNLIIDWLLQE